MEATKRRAVFITALAPIAWGCAYYVTRAYLPPNMPLSGSVIRSLPAGLLLLAIAPARPRGDWWWKTAIISLLTVGGFFVLIYIAGQRLPSGVAATLMASSAVVVLLLARVLLDERPPMRTYAGAFAGVVGVALLVGGATGGLDPWGVVVSLVAMLATSLGFVLTKRWQPPVRPLTFAAWQLTGGALMVAPIALAVEGTPPPLDGRAIGGFVYLTLIATALAYAAWFHGLQQLSAGTVGLIGLLNPLAGALLGILVAQETLSAAQSLGALAILLGVVAGLDRTPKTQTPPPTQPPLAHRKLPDTKAPLRTTA